MIRPVDTIALLALLALLVLLAVTAEGRTWRPAREVPTWPELVRDPAEPLGGATMKFDLLFCEPDLALR